MGLMQEHQDAVRRVAEVPGFGLDSALQMIAEVGPKAAAFEVAKALSSWVGVCPGNEESAGESHSTRSPKGNRQMRRLLDQAAQSAVKVKRKHFRSDISSPAAASGIPAGHLGHCPSALPTALADTAQGGALRGARSGRKCQVQTHAHSADDQRTPQARLSRGRWASSSGGPGMITWVFRPCPGS